jgi:hypothetical protein
MKLKKKTASLFTPNFVKINQLVAKLTRGGYLVMFINKPVFSFLERTLGQK